jgi:predicted MFS family arabinose efflux permease
VIDGLRASLDALRQGTLRRALLAFLVFSVAEWATWITLLVWAYQERGVHAAAVVAVVQLVPAVVVAPLGSVLGDRPHRGRVLAVGYGLQATAMLLTSAALVSDAPFVLTCACGVLVTCAITLTRPVHNATLPSISHTPAELVAGNSASITAEGVGGFLGPLVCGVLLGTVGPGAVYLLFGALLVGAAALVVALPVVHVGDHERSEVAGFTTQALDGLSELRHAPASALLLVMVAGQYVVVGALDILLIVFALDVLGTGPSGPGLLSSALGVGAVLGAVASVALVGRRRLAPALLTGLLVTGVPLSALALGGQVAVSALLLVAWAGKAFFDVAARTLLQRTVPDDVLARVFGVQEALMTAALAGGAAIAPLLVDSLGIRGALAVVGGLLPVSGLLSWRVLRLLDARSRHPGPHFELLRTVPFFRSAPLPVVEQLSRRTEDDVVAAGTVVIRERDSGDRFYLVSDGTVSVSQEGRHLSRLDAPTSFGEVALLRDSPRTATVIADVPTRLVWIGRDDFLRAMRSVPAARESADDVAQRHLDADQRRSAQTDDEAGSAGD